MKHTTSMNIIDEICKEKGIEEKFLSFGWIRELKKDGKIRHIVRNTFDLNPAACMYIVNDKYATYEVLKENSVPTLEYNIIFNSKIREDFEEDIEEKIKDFFKRYSNKIVIKTNNSSEGKGVFYFEKEDLAIDKVKELFLEKESSINICPFENIEEEYRAVYLDGEILFLYKKIRKDKEAWKLNLANGAVPIEVKQDDIYRKKVLDIAIRAGKAVNAKFVTIDICRTIDNRLFVMEINGSVCMSKFAEQFLNGYKITKSIYEKAIDYMFIKK